MGSSGAMIRFLQNSYAGTPAPPPAGPLQEEPDTTQGERAGGGGVGRGGRQQEAPVVVWPHMLVTASLHDERVPVWGPAK
jgi:hypothetical protein